jgi:hypothetical protein
MARGRRAPRGPRGSGRSGLALGAAGALIFLLVAWTAAGTKSATFDEAPHLLSGYRILTGGDLAFNHEHPPLMKMLAALPLVLTGSAQPPARWNYDSEREMWPLSHRWLYHDNDGDRLLAMARLSIAIIGALLGFAVFLTVGAITGAPGRGAAAASAALFLFLLEPNLLAHGSLVTTDLGMAAFFFAGAAAFWRFLETRLLVWLILAGAAWGLDIAAKFTGILLGAVFLAMGIAWLATRRRGGEGDATRDGAEGPPGGRGRRLTWGLRIAGGWPHLALAMAIASAVALLVLDASYGFSGVFTPLREMHLESERFRELAAGPLGAIPLPVPAPFVAGFDHAEGGGQAWNAYLHGEYSTLGWRHYYLTALAVKTSIPLILFALVGLLLGGRAGAHARTRWILLVLPPALLLAVFTFSVNLKNIGLRYVLGVYPFLCALGGLGIIVLLRSGRKPVAAAAIFLCAWAAAGELYLYPDHLAWFNLVSGGPPGGYRWLVDSNLDWGQDLKGLGRWMKAEAVPSIWLDYFGRGCPNYERVKTHREFEGGWLAVSATNLVGVYRPTERDRYDFLKGVEPKAVIGHSIFIYDVPKPDGWVPMVGTPSR